MSDPTLELARQVLDIEIEGISHIRDDLSPAFTQAVELLAACPGRVALTGIGKSGLIGRKIAATLSSTGTPAYFLHPVESLHGDLGFVRSHDVIIAISHSGNTEELLDLLPHIRALGAKLIAMTGGLDSPLAKFADIVLDCSIPREACATTQAPTASTTATLALGDALAVCLMEKKSLTAADFKRNHPGGSLGSRLALRAGDIMHRDHLPLANQGSSLAEALAVLDGGGFGIVLLTDDDARLTGVLTDGDVRRLFCRGDTDTAAPVASVMVREPSRATPDMSAAQLLDIMERKLITALPVVDADGRVIGLAHLHDLLGRGSLRFHGIQG
jgi:arabinose-5-phosphate isomerase